MIKGFKEFVMRGNVVDLAVAVVMGAAFGALVTSLVEDLVTPLIAVVFGQPDFSALTVTVNDSVLRYGEFLNAVISFLSIAAGVYFLIVAPINRLREPEEQATRNCPECTSEIPSAASRCPQCTATITPLG